MYRESEVNRGELSHLHDCGVSWGGRREKKNSIGKNQVTGV